MLGMRAKRRPAGYWAAIENLDREIDSFTAASWVAMPHPDSGTARIRLQAPPMELGHA